MPLFGAAARSEPSVVVWRSSSGELVGREFDALGDAEDFWSQPSLLLCPCVLFIQRPDSEWISWRSYGWESKVEAIRRDFRDADVRRQLFESSEAVRPEASVVSAVAVAEGDLINVPTAVPVVNATVSPGQQRRRPSGPRLRC